MASGSVTLLSILPKRLRTPLMFQITIFIVSFLLYAAVHAVRKTVSTIQKPMKEIGYTSSFFSYLSSAFMLSYSLGMMWTGVLGDRYKPTIVLLIACLGSAALTCVVGFMVPDFNSTSYWVLYTVLWTLNGLFQSCVWPVEVKLVSKWFSDNHSGSLFGIWSANSSVGNILGIGLTAMTVSLWGKGATGITMSFVLPSLVLVFVAGLTFFLPNTKKDAGIICPSEEEDNIAVSEGPTREASIVLSESKDPNVSVEAESSSRFTGKLSIFRAWLLPGVLRYAFCYACIKSVNYTMFYWLTGFLEQFGYTSSNAYMVTIMNDVGWILGGLACGYGTDKMGLRAPIVGLFILLSIIPTALIYPFMENVATTAIMIGLNGFFSGGAGNVVASAVCADIGKNDKVAGSKDITGQVAGIIDGVGAFGAAVTMLIVGHLSDVDMGAVFYALTGMLAVAFLLISDLVYRDTRTWLRSRRNNVKDGSCSKGQLA